MPALGRNTHDQHPPDRGHGLGQRAQLHPIVGIAQRRQLHTLICTPGPIARITGGQGDQLFPSLSQILGEWLSTVLPTFPYGPEMPLVIDSRRVRHSR